ncbi:hypothetical protein, conserved [Leishmania tarentolae]|uniref:Uncharacterized protein n=1 Tax=Leishmania tarentolae TaxID=5689 RepID=A0A640KSS7_LEITA|nr:hypothetical protein, conserved [Leishmania tarentolae]
MPSRSSGIGDGEVLIRLDTSVLESRLNAFTDEWETSLKSIRTQVGASAADVRSVAADVNAIQNFLLSYHKQTMEAALVAHPTEASCSATQSDTQGLLDRFVATANENSSTENLLGTVAVARCLLDENRSLRTSLDSATAALSTKTTCNADLIGEVEQLRQQTTQHSALLQRITLWLRTLGFAFDDGAGVAAGNGISLPVNVTVESTTDGHSMESILSRSPLLLSFRQILLRDLTERLKSVVDQQSKEFHDAVSHLEDHLQRGGKGASGSGAAQLIDVAEELQDTVRSLTKGLKDMEKRAVKRDEFTSLMRTKADSLLLPAKADNAALTDLETRLLARCAELEERCAFADAERAEFRALLRSLIVSQAHPKAAGAVQNVQEASQTSSQVPSKTRAQGTLLGEILPAVKSDCVMAAPESLCRRESAPSHPHSASAPQQLYRVLGTSHGSGIHGINFDSATQKGYTKSVGSVSPVQYENVQMKAASSPSADEGIVAIGIAPTQGNYGAHVSGPLTRRKIASLPTLPYEKGSNR